MDDAKKKAIEYLSNKINSISYDDMRFTIFVGDGKYVMGSISPDGETNTIANNMQYKTVYNTLTDLDFKIKISFINAIDYAYRDEVYEDFRYYKKGSEEETLSYYHIENAMFRTVILWDMLAQLYRIYYEIDVDKDKVQYKSVFNPKSRFSKKFVDDAKEINDYILQKDDGYEGEGEWKGNHSYISGWRNKMMHRNAPSVATMSDYDINNKKHPAYMLKRIIEDYVVVSKYIEIILDRAEEEIMNDFK